MIRAVIAARRHESERGASLVIALAMILIVSVAIVAVLAYATTSLHTIAVIKDQRQVLYTADSAVQTAMQSVRTDATIGTGATCPSLNYSSMGKSASVACTVVQARGPGSPGVDFPPYAVWAVGPSNAESGISDDKSGTLTIGGPIASNEGAGAVPGIDSQNMDVTGYTVDSRGPCVGTIKVADPSDLRCDTGLNYPDPNYPSQALPSLSNPNPAPTCGVANSTLTFHPGYYTNVRLFNQPPYGACQNGVVYFEPGVYYFDFDFDPAYAAAGSSWDMNIKIVGGEYKGWDPTQANSVPPAPGGGTSKACKTELDGATSGVQFVFGGGSLVDANSNSSQIELCASPQPTGTKQQIVLYGQKTGADPTPQTVTSQAASTDPPTPTPNPPGGWTGLAPVNNLLPIAPNPSAIDGQVATYALPAASPGSAVAMQLKGFPGVTVPGGSINVNYTLKVAHREVQTSNNSVGDLKLQIGSCTVTVPANTTAALKTDTFSDACIPAAVSGATFDATFTATAANGKAITEILDGVELTVNWTPPAVRAQNGCVTAIGGCHFLDLAKNQAVFVAWGTVYAPLAWIFNDFKNKSGYEFRRGVIARTVRNVAVPPSDSQSSFCLGYGNPCIGPSRILRFTATVNGSTALVALVQYFDAPTIGRSMSVLSWNQVRS